MSKTRRRGTLIALLIAGVLAAALANTNLAPTQAQTGSTNMRAMIETLNAQVASRPGFETYFQLEQPLFAGETLIGLGGSASRTISEVGDDYVCFSEPWNNSRRVHCTPFSNVVSVSYIE